MQFHVDAASAEGYTLGFEAETLLGGGVSAQFDFAASAQYALPGQVKGSA